MKLNYLSLYATLLISCCFFLACNNDLDQPASTKGVDYLTAIESMGFDPSSAVEAGDYFLVEGDILLDKSRLEEWISECAVRQARYKYIIDESNRYGITVKCDSNVPLVWQEAVDGAIKAWNGMDGIFLKRVTSGTADITIYMENISSVANANMPKGNGKPGTTIRINPAYNNSYDPGQKIFVLVHEMGHSLGFEHTNWRNNGETGAINISGTDENDYFSFMHSSSGGRSWYEYPFTKNDSIAIKTVYPSLYYRFYDYKRNTDSGARTINAKYVCKEEVEAQITIYYSNDVYNTEPGKVSFNANMGGVSYIGKPGSYSQTVRLAPGLHEAYINAYQLFANRLGGYVSGRIVINNIKNIATGKAIPDGGISLEFNLTTSDHNIIL